jgi:hypothetical protein
MPRPSLRFDPYAWGKFVYLRDRGDTEIGGFGLSAEEDPLLVIDVLTVKQRCSFVTVAFDDEAVADLFDDLVDQGIPPERFGRIWLHTHPGDCPLPSSTDEATFRRVFGRTDWAVMGIVARNDATCARLAFHVGPGGSLEIPVRVDYGQAFDGADWEAWEQEYIKHVSTEQRLPPVKADDIYVQQPIAEKSTQELWNWEDDFYGGPAGARPF